MSLFAIADLHLSLGTDKPMSVFRGWDDYVGRLEKNWRRLVGEDDTVVVAGDISWAMNLEEATADFTFLNGLPGRKLLLKGNHDYWWTTRRKMDTYFKENGFSTLQIIHNDAATAGEYAVCGTRGWFYDAEADEDKKILMREVGRFHASATAAAKTGKERLAFLHYPPVFGNAVCREILDALKEEGITRCYYGHVHSTGIRRAFNGEYEGVCLQLISCDALEFTPLKIF